MLSVNAMPIIRITSLPFENQDSSAWPKAVCEAFSTATEIPLQHVSVTWQLLPCGHYAHAGHNTYYQPNNSHPLIVEILLPDFYALDRVEKIMQCTVSAIHDVVGMPKENIFVQVNRARSGAVYDEGRVVRW